MATESKARPAFDPSDPDMVRAAKSGATPPKPAATIGKPCVRCSRPGPVECKIGDKSFRLCADCANALLHVAGIEQRKRIKA